MNDTVLNIEKLVIGHKIPLKIEPINLSANRKSLICIIGRNGSGKTTFLNTIVGVLNTISGNINICGKALSKINSTEKSKYVSFVPSKIESVMNMTSRDLISVGRTPYTNIFDFHSESDDFIIDSAIEKFGLSHIAHSLLSELSDGERQKVMICRSIVQQTPIILLDEPTAFLDYFAKRKLLSELKAISETENKCIIFSCHDIEIATNYCSEIWLLDNEKLISLSVADFVGSGYFSKYL